MLFKSAVDDLHLQGGVLATDETDAVHVHIVCYAGLIYVTIGILCGASLDGNDHAFVPVGIVGFPLAFAQVLGAHSFFLFGLYV